ncbi:MAG: tetratricopeptide repeat protein [Candidatus Alcyoniella australis]|nr:tetratricopeptide repeat protein [Candidatus Alcyoniella australis]
MSFDNITSYKILDVVQGASEREIRVTFLRHVKNLHPDAPDVPHRSDVNGLKLRNIQVAYDYLMAKHYCELYDGDSSEERKQMRSQIKYSRAEGNGLEPFKQLVRRLVLELNYHELQLMLRQGRYADAIVRLNKMLVHRSRNWVLQLRLAEACLGSGSLNPAITAAQRAQSLGGDQAWCHLLFGRARERMGNLREAEMHYRLAYGLNPDDSQIQIEFQRGSLVAEAANKHLKRVARNFLPTSEAESFRYYPGLLKLEDMLRVSACMLSRVKPDSNARSFRLSAIY